jgi:hypothetical protein
MIAAMNNPALSRTFLDALRSHRGRHWLLAQRVGLHPSTLSNWLHGSKTPKPWDSRVPALGALIGVAPSDCFAATSDAGVERVA